MPRHGTGAKSSGREPRRTTRQRGRGPFGRLLRALELPGDLLLDLPRVTVVGTLQITVENHRGLIEYHPERVSIAVLSGSVRVEGDDLEIGVVAAQEVTVLGNLRQIAFVAE